MNRDPETLHPSSLLRQLEKDLLLAVDQASYLCFRADRPAYQALGELVRQAHAAAYQLIQEDAPLAVLVPPEGDEP